MIYQQTTQVPNALFDHYLPLLTESELKIMLIVIRQTNGWVDIHTGKRKTRDRISYSQFMRKARLSRRVISNVIKSLIVKGLLIVTDFNGNFVHSSEKRKGKTYLYYSCPLRPAHKDTLPNAPTRQQPVQQSAYNKTNYTKRIKANGILDRQNHLSSMHSLLEMRQKHQKYLQGNSKQ